jgi:hypothetical protein
VVLALAVALTAPVVLAAGQLFVPTGGHTLRSLPGVEIILETIPEPLQQAGLTQAAVKADLERWLRAGGVPVYQSQPDNPSAAKAYLDLRTTVLALRDGSYAVAVQMHVRQTVKSLATESSIVNAATWETGRLVNVTLSGPPRVRDEIRGMADEFVAEWKGAHP